MVRHFHPHNLFLHRKSNTMVNIHRQCKKIDHLNNFFLQLKDIPSIIFLIIKKRLHVVLIIVLLTTSGLVRSVLAALSGVTKVVHWKAFARGTSKLTWNAYTVFLIRAVFTVIVTIANQIFAYTLSIVALKSIMVFTSETYKICNCWWVRDVGANSQEINILTKRCRSSRVVMGSVGTF